MNLSNLVRCQCVSLMSVISILIDVFQGAGPDPGFSVGGAWTHFGGFWPPTWALFSENVCENERIGSCRGRAPARPLDPPMRGLGEIDCCFVLQLCLMFAILLCFNNDLCYQCHQSKKHLKIILKTAQNTIHLSQLETAADSDLSDFIQFTQLEGVDFFTNFILIQDPDFFRPRINM